MKKLDRQTKKRLLIQAGACLDRCRLCRYSRTEITAFCESCPNYQELSSVRRELFPNRKEDFHNKQIQKILEKGEMMQKDELEYLLTAKVPNRIIADRLDITVKELKQIIDAYGI